MKKVLGILVLGLSCILMLNSCATTQYESQSSTGGVVARDTFLNMGESEHDMRARANRQCQANSANTKAVVTFSHKEGSDFKVYNYKCVDPSQTTTSTSSSSSGNIAQAKQICKDLGFKTNTEKFADCSLKMLSMQFEVQNRETSSDGGTQQKIVVQQGYSVGDAMIALSGIISDANNVRSSYGGGNCRIFQHAYHASLKCN